jgi:4-hydroxy-tetrahydrodipicolinate synthase
MKYQRHEAKTWARETLRDYMVTLTTPFDENLQIDEAGLRRNVNRIVGLDSIGSLYVGGYYQESMAMTMAEQKRVTEIVIDAVAGRKPVMIWTGATSIADSIELTQHAQEAGADLAMVWPPHVGFRTKDGVLDWLRTVIRSADIGIGVYATRLAENGFYVDASMLEVLAEEDNVCCVKEASFNLAMYLDTLERLGEKIVVSCPVEEHWIYGRMLMGDRYAAPVLLATSRPLYLETEKQQYLGRFLNAERSGNLADISSTLRDLLKVADQIHNKYINAGTHNPAINKAVTEMMGYASGPVRPPLTWPAEAELRDAHDVLERAGLLDAATTSSS